MDAHGVDSLCVVQTAGVLPWTDGVTADALLTREDRAIDEGVCRIFGDSGAEPFVVDLRPFQTLPDRERQKDPEYLSKVASIAAKVLHKDKEILWGEHLRAQRLRTTFLSIVSLILLALALALGIAVLSIGFQR